MTTNLLFFFNLLIFTYSLFRTVFLFMRHSGLDPESVAIVTKLNFKLQSTDTQSILRQAQHDIAGHDECINLE